MLKINGLTKIYGRSDVKAVDDLSLEVESGEIFGFIGPNGAGKSTTIKCVTGITGFNAGTIEVNGFDVRKNPIEAKRSIGYVSDSHVVYDQLTGAEYVDFMASIYGVADKESYKSRLENYIDVFGLKDAFNEPIKSYSHGMQQKINVIGAIIHNPPLLILDEPLTGLDPQSAYELKEMMKEHCKNGGTVFFSSHVLDVVEKICDRVGIISEGKLRSVGTIDELRENGDASLESYFLSVTKNDDENEKNQ
jgi:ABC-2 type transport system ATP-binding protein